MVYLLLNHQKKASCQLIAFTLLLTTYHRTLAAQQMVLLPHYSVIPHSYSLALSSAPTLNAYLAVAAAHPISSRTIDPYRRNVRRQGQGQAAYPMIKTYYHPPGLH